MGEVPELWGCGQRVKPPLLIVALSGRMLANSAKMAGYAPLVVDLYGDLDTRAVSRVWRRAASAQGGFDAAALLEAAQGLVERHQPMGWLYGSGVDRLPDVVRGLAQQCPLFGNVAEVAEICIRPGQFFPLLDHYSIPYPEIRWTPPSEAGWLLKQGGEGGSGVRVANGQDFPQGAYFQRRLRGSVYTLAFLAGRGRLHWFGFNTLYTTPYNGSLNFLFGGAINRAVLDQRVKDRVVNYARRLCRALDLRGWHGLDFMLDDSEKPRVLELNPRPGAVLGLWEEPGWSGVAAQVRVCKGGRLKSLPQVPVRAFRIVYATVPVSIPLGWRWPEWCADIPAPGTDIDKGQPVCSVTAAGEAVEKVEAVLGKRIAWLGQRLLNRTTAEVGES